MAQTITLLSNKTAMSGILISQFQTAPVTAPAPKTQGALKKFEAIPGAKLYYILIDADADVANYANRRTLMPITFVVVISYLSNRDGIVNE